MRLNKAQAAVITALNIVIVALIAVIFLVPYFGGRSARGDDAPVTGDKPNNIEPEVPEHVKLRGASEGKAEGILRETRLMGSGDETVVAVKFRDGVSYIFGNATVADLDFDSYGGFLCVVNAAGTMLSYTYFEGAIGAVCPLSGGFAVAAGESLYFTDYTGKIDKRADTDGGALEIVPTLDGNKIAVITQPTSTALKLTEYSMTGDMWSAGSSTRIDSGFTLKFFDCYCFVDSYVISARAYSLPRYDAAVLYSFTAGGDATAHYYGGTGENITRPYAVMPCAAGYFALASKNGLATVITVDYAFMSYHSINLGFTFSDARLFFENGKYYACFDRLDGAATFELEDNLSRRRLSALDGLFIDCVFETDKVLCAGTVKNAAASATGEDGSAAAEIIAPYTESSRSFDIKSAEFYGGFQNTDGLTLVLSATGGDALSAPSGGRDIYIVTLAEEI